MLRQPQLVPEVDQVVDFDVPPDVFISPLGEDDLVNLETLAPIAEIPGLVGASPKDVLREGNDAIGLFYRRVIYILGESDRARPTVPAAVDQDQLTGFHRCHRTGGQHARL
jgi:hypothetical protein